MDTQIRPIGRESLRVGQDCRIVHDISKSWLDGNTPDPEDIEQFRESANRLLFLFDTDGGLEP